MINKKIPSEIAIGVVLLVAIIIGGAFYLKSKEGATVIAPKDQPLRDQKTTETLQKQAPNIQRQNEATISDATTIEGWKKYTSAEKSFSIEYPSNWQVSGMTFSDTNGKKIAEFLPGLVTLEPNQNCFDDLKIDTSRVKVISKSDIIINKQQGVLLIQRVVQNPGGNISFPNIYCLKKENEAFVMAFYDNDSNSSQKELFNKVISTLEFE